LDYLLPTAAEVPDLEYGHVVTPWRRSASRSPPSRSPRRGSSASSRTAAHFGDRAVSNPSMANASFGNHSAVRVPRAQKDRIRRFYRDVLGCGVMREGEQKDDF